MPLRKSASGKGGGKLCRSEGGKLTLDQKRVGVLEVDVHHTHHPDAHQYRLVRRAQLDLVIGTDRGRGELRFLAGHGCGRLDIFQCCVICAEERKKERKKLAHRVNFRRKAGKKKKKKESSGMNKPFFFLITMPLYTYSPRMIRLERIYIPLMPLSHIGSSKGIFFDTCIIPRITTRLVLRTCELATREKIYKKKAR